MFFCCLQFAYRLPFSHSLLTLGVLGGRVSFYTQHTRHQYTFVVSSVVCIYMHSIIYSFPRLPAPDSIMMECPPARVPTCPQAGHYTYCGFKEAASLYCLSARGPLFNAAFPHDRGASKTRNGGISPDVCNPRPSATAGDAHQHRDWRVSPSTDAGSAVGTCCKSRDASRREVNPSPPAPPPPH